MIVAHRGASFDAPENTLPAFKLAWEKGADAIEGDFLLTKDNQIVCIHDKTTKRLSDQNLVVAESSLEQLKTLDVGSWKNKKYKGTQIPTISEVFATVPKGKKIFVEVKCGLEIIPYLVKEIQKSDLKMNQVRLICFNQGVIKALKETMPNYKAYWLAGFKNKQGTWKPSLEEVLGTLQACKADGLDSQHTIPQEFCRAVLRAGLEWHAWTINHVKTAKRLAKRGIYSITTDRPKLIGSGLNN
ncbi:MAG: glycerophosphodiester phosphodiesterase [Verrucomicrobiota bacterium]|nr:glycerophosphodiester phosphodiesterase [Verrucomicrobiota bacterium]